MTVASETNSARAMSWLLWPSASSCSTSNSRADTSISDPTAEPTEPTKLTQRELWRRFNAWALQMIRWAWLWIPALLILAFVLRSFNVWQHIDV